MILITLLSTHSIAAKDADTIGLDPILIGVIVGVILHNDLVSERCESKGLCL